MPTENRRVAAYLPKSIDDRLEVFKTERGLKGDSPALIAILEEYFEVSREVTHLSNTPIDLEAIKSELLSELKSELLGSISAIKSELLSELKSELHKVDHLEEVSIPTPEVDQQTVTVSEPLPEHISDSPLQADEAEEKKDSDLPSEQKSELLDGSTALTGVELSRRLIKAGRSEISKRKTWSEEDFAEWTRKKDPDGIAWRRAGNRFVPILEDFQGF